MKIRWYIYVFFFVVALGVIIFSFIRPYDLFLRRITGVSLAQLMFGKGNLDTIEGKVNFLLLGKAGEEYDGSDLTDSIIVISVDTRQKKIYTISIPRDIWSYNLQDKINTAYYYGKIKGKGFAFAKNEIESITGVKIHYVAVIDFSRFKELIDYVGGIDVLVDRSFDDYKYPIAGRANDLCDGDSTFACRYEHIKFQKGLTRMDGARALQFARSRNAQGDEGTDFARGQRQQKMLTTLYEKITLRIKKMKLDDLQKTYTLLDRLIERDIENKEVLYFAKEIIRLGKKITFHEIRFPHNLLIVPSYSLYHGKYVLIPKGGNFNSIRFLIQEALHNTKDMMMRKSAVPIMKKGISYIPASGRDVIIL